MADKKLPPIHNILVRTPEGDAIRKAFAPPNLLNTNYSQIELRILEHLASDGLYEHRIGVPWPPCPFCEEEKKRGE